MNGEDILRLVNAGFTKEEIGKMFANNTEQKPKEEKAVEQPEKKEEVKQETVSPLEAKMDKLLGAIAAGNFLGANQPKQETVDDVIASIINPANPFVGGDNNGSK